jgi:hypothetical protein
LAILLPEDFWLGVLALCGVGAVWVIWHYIFVDCRQPLKPPVQRMIHEQAPFGLFSSNSPAAIQAEEKLRVEARREAEEEYDLRKQRAAELRENRQIDV